MTKEAISLPADPKKRADALTAALCAAIELLAVVLPRAAREAVQRAREALDVAEGAAIRAALERCQWRLAPAAELLGFPRPSALEKLVQAGRRHEAIGKEIERHRRDAGYSRGRPPAAEDIPPVGQNATPRRRRNAP